MHRLITAWAFTISFCALVMSWYYWDEFRPSVAEAAVQSSVKVLMAQGPGHGSGVMVGKGLVLTNAHVCQGPSKRLRLQNREGDIIWAKVLWISNPMVTDLCMIQADSPELWVWKPVKLAGDNPKIGDEVFTVGNPLIAEFHISWGKISRYNPDGYYYMDMNVQPGNSGGGIFNSQGELIGLVNSVIAAGGWQPIGLGVGRGPTLDVIKRTLARN